MTATRQQIIDQARTYQGVPYLHQGRNKGGVDCIGLIVAVLMDLDIHDFSYACNYSIYPDGQTLIDRVAEHCTATANPQPGDLLIFRIRKAPQHCAILSSRNGEETLIHAYQGVEYVSEHGFDAKWRSRLVQAFALPGVA